MLCNKNKVPGSIIVNVPWYVSKSDLHGNLGDEIVAKAHEDGLHNHTCQCHSIPRP